MAVNTILNYTCELTHGVVKTNMRPALLSGDQHAHKIMVAVTQDNANVSLSGCAVKGYFLRPDGATVVIDGAANGNYAVVTLPADCYALPGLFSLVIRVSIGTVINTVFWGEGMVGRSTSDIVVDPGEVLPSLDAMLALVERAEAAAQAIGGAAPVITCNVAGEVIGVQDAANRAPRVLNLYGNTTQAAAPTPDAPADMTNAASGGTVNITVTGANILGGEALADRFAATVSVTRDDEARTISFHASSMSGKVFFTQFRPNTRYTLILYGSNGTAVTNLHIRYTDGSVDTPKFAASGEASYAVLVTDAGKSVEALRGSYSNGRTTLYYDRCGIFEGALTAADFEAYAGQTMAVAVPDGLRGIPVAADGNHVDASGQHWMADYIDIHGKGLYNVLDSFTLDGSEGYEWTIGTGSGVTVAYVGPQDKWSAHDAALVDDTRIMSTHFVGGMMTAEGHIKLDSNFLNMSVPSAITSSADMNAWLAANPVTVLYVRETPIHTPLALDDITLPSPDAAAYNDSGCSMHLTYDADTKTYIDNRIAAIAAAVL